MTRKTVNVPNISCGHCVATIERELKEVRGVSEVKADPSTRNVTVSWDPEAGDWVAIENTLVDIGYPPAG